MNCSECRLALHAHLDDELEVANSRAVEEHVATCAACTEESAALRALGETARAQRSGPEPPAGFGGSGCAPLRDAAPAARPVRRARDSCPASARGGGAAARVVRGLRDGRPGARERALEQLVALHSARPPRPARSRSPRPTATPSTRGSRGACRSVWGRATRRPGLRAPSAAASRPRRRAGVAALVYRHGAHVVTLVVRAHRRRRLRARWSDEAGYRSRPWCAPPARNGSSSPTPTERGSRRSSRPPARRLVTRRSAAAG
jgi:hypothetical protein